MAARHSGCRSADERMLKGLNMLTDFHKRKDWTGLDNGLSNEENRRLAASHRPSEIAALISLGLGRNSEQHRQRVSKGRVAQERYRFILGTSPITHTVPPHTLPTAAESSSQKRSISSRLALTRADSASIAATIAFWVENGGMGSLIRLNALPLNCGCPPPVTRAFA